MIQLLKFFPLVMRQGSSLKEVDPSLDNASYHAIHGMVVSFHALLDLVNQQHVSGHYGYFKLIKDYVTMHPHSQPCKRWD